jgi:hypothetical protein
MFLGCGSSATIGTGVQLVGAILVIAFILNLKLDFTKSFFFDLASC